MRVHVLLYDSGKESEGIHSLELSGQVIVLMFENPEDAERYSGLLAAQDFPTPTVEEIDREEIEAFCVKAGYETRFVETGFVPKTEEERLLLSPPIKNKDVVNWQEKVSNNGESENESNLDSIRQRLEGLL
ncbi:DUF3110 domain-containing protein [Prochlorococcus sp. MIT 1341]|uniref:DUF3110 domain-containing protein n=1 Tax=Prochlorococcus sp. MIT 1341 TaxID=3096221 RepID=UPI002A756825|nr:DUF3110 domain-containing protein [Prochlorococcus sp. MIT 1341]